MEKIALLYGTPLWQGGERNCSYTAWWSELFALDPMGLFHIAYFNYSDFMWGGEPLKVAAQDWGEPPAFNISEYEGKVASAVKPKKKDNPTILRCPYMDKEHYEALERELPRFGYRLITDS